MAWTKIQDHTWQGTKTAGTNNLAVVVAAGGIPAARQLFALIAFDNTSVVSPVVSSIAKQSGEVSDWVKLAEWDSFSTSVAAGCRGELWAIETTKTWAAGSYTITLSASVAAKACQPFEFSGGTLTQRSVAGSGKSQSSISVSTSGDAPVAGDLVIACVGAENGTLWAADTDTLRGAWSAQVGNVTSGGLSSSNIGCAYQHKIVTGAGHQTFDTSGTNDGGALIVALTPEPVVKKAADYEFLIDWDSDEGYDIGSFGAGTDNFVNQLGQTGVDGWYPEGSVPPAIELSDAAASEMEKVTLVEASGENPGAGEVATNVADDDVYTKWLVFATTGWLKYTLSSATTIVKYTLTSANDFPNRDPKSWNFQGSNDGTNWTTLDTRREQTFDRRFHTETYEFINTTAYQYYRLDITANNGNGSATQLAGWKIFDDTPERSYAGGTSLLVTWTKNNPFQFDVAGAGFDDGKFGRGDGTDTTNPGGTDPRIQNDHDELVIGESYILRARVYVPTGSPHVLWGVNGSLASAASGVRNQWTLITHTFTATATSHALQIHPQTAPNGGEKWWVDDCQILLSGEDVTSRTLIEGGVAIRLGRDINRATGLVTPAETGILVNNRSKDYSPDNTNSPLAGYLAPGRKFLARVHHNERRYSLIHGYLDDFVIDPSRMERNVTFSAVDALARLNEQKLSTELHPSKRTGELVHIVLDAVNWPADKRDIDPGATTVSWWWEEDTTALEALQKLVKAEGPPSFVTVDGGGRFVFRDRHHRLLRDALNAGRATEDFEDDTFNFTIANGGNAAWARNTSDPAHDGTGSFKSGTITHSQTSDAIVTVPPGATKCRFWYKVSSESGFDKLRFLVGSSQKLDASGEIGWTQSDLFDIPAGVTTVTFRYAKDGSISSGSDAAWIDDLEFHVPVTTFRDTGAEPRFSAPMAYDIGWREIANSVTATVEERGGELIVAETQGANGEPIFSPVGVPPIVWEDENLFISLAVGETRTIHVQTDDPFYAARTPVDAGTVYDEFRVLTGTVSVSLSRTSGQSAEIAVTASTAAQIQGMALRAFPITVLRTLQVDVLDAVSIEKYGVRSYTDDIPWAGVHDVEAIATLILGQRAERLPTVSITVKNASDTRLAQMLDRDLSDRVRIIEAETFTDHDHYIEQIEHTIREGGKFHETVFGCERVRAQVSNVFTFDKTGAGFDDGLFGYSGLDDPNSIFILDSSELDKGLLGH